MTKQVGIADPEFVISTVLQRVGTIREIPSVTAAIAVMQLRQAGYEIVRTKEEPWPTK